MILEKTIIKKRDVRSITMLKYMVKDVEIAIKKHTHIHNFYLINNKGSLLISLILLRKMFLIFPDLKNKAVISSYKAINNNFVKHVNSTYVEEEELVSEIINSQ